ncbi:hypothetical protein [Paenibacillus kandeliae]|uniref:hypothetical protein n=1 Tax=Paenibacillus kandeliae TaxID=3231269 RepID=UPI0034596D64
MWLVFLCMLVAYLIQRHLDHKKSANEATITVPDVSISSKLLKEHESDTYDLTYKSAWIAIHNDAVNSENLEYVLKSHDIQAEVLLFQPTNGWTILSAEELPDLNETEHTIVLLDILEELSSRLGEIQYFANHRTVHYYAWAKFEDGKMKRAYSYEWDTMMDEGEQTAIEKSIFPSYMHNGELLPDEELVLKIAEEWSFVPEGMILSKRLILY